MPFSVDAGVPFTLDIRGGEGEWPIVARSVRWIFSGTTFPCAGFVGDQNSGRWLPLQPGDGPEITFISRRRGVETVTATFSVEVGGEQLECTIQTDVTVRAPTPLPVSFQGADVKVGTVQRPNGNYTAMSTGVRFTFAVLAQDGAAGHIAMVQLVKSFKKGIRRDETMWISTTDRAYMLDGGADGSFIYFNNPVQAGITVFDLPLLHVDNPSVELTDEDEFVMVDDVFLATLMFKSSSPQAQWVPLRTVTWGWAGFANYSAEDDWQLVFGNLKEVVTFEPPPDLISWQHNVRDIHHYNLEPEGDNSGDDPINEDDTD